MDSNNKETDGLLGNRLRSWRKNTGKKGYELANLIKVSAASLSEIESNKSLPSATTLAKFSKYTNLNIIWLLTGEGRMSLLDDKEDDDEVRYPELLELYGSLKRIIKTGDDRKTERLKGFILGADPGN